MNGRRGRAVIVAAMLLGPGALVGCSASDGSTSAAGSPVGSAPLVSGPAPVTGSDAPAADGALPPPALDTRSASSDTETATLAGGCFWGVQGVFEHVAGVLSAVSGYAGGAAGTADYEQVGTGTTGHAESVEITFDPRTITYGQILQIFFSVVHDPTQLDRQGPDVGEQYRSTIFPVDDDQARVARAYIDQLEQARAFDGAIVTTIEPGRAFYPAEGYHQDFLERNPTYPYIVRNDLPKVAALAHVFPERYRAEPVLVGGDDPAG